LPPSIVWSGQQFGPDYSEKNLPAICKLRFPMAAEKFFSAVSGKFFTIPECKLQPFFTCNNEIFLLNSRAVSPNYLNTLMNPYSVAPVIRRKSEAERIYAAYPY
jgi:hypothetical protein